MIVIDTETTGLDPKKHAILQLSIIDENRKVLFNSYFKPSIEHYSNLELYSDWIEASKIHGITPKYVVNNNAFDDNQRNIVQKLIDSADYIVGFNPIFDVRFLRRYGIVFKPETKLIDPMKDFADFYKQKPLDPSNPNNPYKFKLKSLKFCCDFLSVKDSDFSKKSNTFSFHNSLDDVVATYFLLQKLKHIQNNKLLFVYYKLKSYLYRIFKK